jgi:N-acetyl-anhydromuramyl-L-alanine amidase AmpD
MKIDAACKLDFFPAYHSSGLRQVKDVFWIVLHDEEAPNAKGAAAYFRSADSGGSAHLCVDQDECYRCLPNTAIPWGAASAFGANTHGFHIEQAGYAGWTKAQWETHANELERAAYKTAVHCHVFKIPPVFVTAEHLPAKHGITTHAEISAASRRLDPGNASRYSHHDPGPGWPREHFMRLVAGYYAQGKGT